MNRRSGIAALFLFALTWSAGAEAQIWSGEKSQIADFFGAAGVTPANGAAALAPSVTIGVSINGKIVFSKGYGAVSPGGATPTGDTVYHLGSLSKQILAAAMLGLIEDNSGPVTAGGKSPAGAAIALDDPITKFVPDSNMFSTGPVSLRNMLNMQSGFASYTSPPANAPDPFDTTKPVKPRELLRYVLSMLHANPSPGGAGAGYAYSNTNYFLLANTIEFFQQKTGDYDYRTFVRARIFQKAGMGNTGFIEDSFPNFAPPPYDLSVASFAAPSWPKGAGEIASSANDMLRWHAALMSDALVSANARKTLMAPVGSAGYAMGWSVSQSGPYTWYTHNGDIPGYVTQDGILRNPATGDWVSVVILANNDNVPGEAFAALCLARLAMDSSPTKAGLSPGTKTTCNIPAGQSKILPGGKPLPLLPLWHPTPPAPGARPR